MEPFNNIRGMIIDMDGVLWHGNQALPGLADLFQTLRAKNIRFILATNNARQTVGQYIRKLASMGVDINSNELLTSATVTAHYIAQHYSPESTRIFVIGEEGLRQPLIEKGFQLTDLFDLNASNQNMKLPFANLVVCGLDKTLTWDKLSTAALNIRAGAQFIATNADTTLPTEFGEAIGNGSILTALTAATGISPTVIGKPEPIMYQQAMALLQTKPKHTIAIGDKLETDILGAIRTGIRSLMVLTGVSNLEDIKQCDYKPTWIMPDIRSVNKALLEI